MFRAFRDLSEGVRGMVVALDRLQRSQAEDLELRRSSGDVEDRLSALETSRAMWEAEVEAEFMKAESSRQAAANAESRTRTMKRAYERNADPFLEDEPDEVVTNRGVLPQQYADNGEEEGVPPVHMDVEDPKQALMRAKFL
jgi:hypothetical protein